MASHDREGVSSARCQYLKFELRTLTYYHQTPISWYQVSTRTYHYQAKLVWDVWAIVSGYFHNITNNEVCVSLVVNIVILDG